MKKCGGITLIALVVTIIVLLILAGVSFSFIAGEKGVLKRATEARTVQIVGEMKEHLMLAIRRFTIRKRGKSNN